MDSVSDSPGKASSIPPRCQERRWCLRAAALTRPRPQAPAPAARFVRPLRSCRRLSRTAVCCLRRPARRDLLHLVEECGSIEVEGESRFERIPRIAPQAAALRRVVHEKGDRLAKPRRIAWWHHKACHSVFDDITLARGCGDHDRLAHRHGLENRGHACLKVVFDQRDCHHGSPRIQLAELEVAGEAGLYVGRPPTRLAMAGARTVHAAIRDIDGDPRFGACPDQRFVIALLASSRDHQPFGGDVAGPPERTVRGVRHQGGVGGGGRNQHHRAKRAHRFPASTAGWGSFLWVSKSELWNRSSSATDCSHPYRLSTRVRPRRPSEAASAGSSSNRTTEAANAAGSSAMSRCSPCDTSRPSHPTVVETTGFAMARASSTFSRVPLPIRRGTTTTEALD